MALFEITNWLTAKVSFSIEAGSMRLAIEAAVSQRSDLRGADLSGADLSGANLRGADLSGANLGGADLGGANLRDANLRGADLSGANLGGADLGGANLRDANLRGANLRDANLRDANLRDANLTPFRDDLWAVLSASPAEVPAMRDALVNGKVDGSTYEGECACLVGTIANVRHCNYATIPNLTPDSGRPAEQWFMGIKPGDTIESNDRVKYAVEWIDLWLANMKAAAAAGAFSA